LTTLTTLQSIVKRYYKQQDIRLDAGYKRPPSTTQMLQLPVAGSSHLQQTLPWLNTIHTCSAILPVPAALETEHDLSALSWHCRAANLAHAATEHAVQCPATTYPVRSSSSLCLPSLTHPQCTPHSVAANVASAEEREGSCAACCSCP